MARVTKINVGGTNYDIAHEGELKNSGFEVVTELPTTGLFEGREVMYKGKKYVYSTFRGSWVVAFDAKKEPLYNIMGDNGSYEILGYDYTTYSNNINRSYLSKYNNYLNYTNDFLIETSVDNEIFTEIDRGNKAYKIFNTTNTEDWNVSSYKAVRLTIGHGQPTTETILSFYINHYWLKVNKIKIDHQLRSDLSWEDFGEVDFTAVNPRNYAVFFSIDMFSKPIGIYGQIYKIRFTIEFDVTNTNAAIYNVFLIAEGNKYLAGINNYFKLSYKLLDCYSTLDYPITLNFDINNIEPTQTGQVEKKANWVMRYLLQGVNWLKANKVALSVYNAKVAALEQADSANNASIQSVSTDLTELSNGLAAVATSGSYNDLIDTPTLADVATSGDYNDLLNRPAFSGSYNDLTDTPNLAAVATSGSYNDLIDTPDLVFSNIGGNVATAQITDGSITNDKLANSSMTLNGISCELGGTKTLPCIISFDSTLYKVRIYQNWLQIYHAGMWVNKYYLLSTPPTECRYITDLSDPSWYDELVSEYELDSMATEQLLRADSSTNIANWIEAINANQITFNSSVIPCKEFNKGALDNIISNLKGKGYSVFVENDIDTILTSGNDWVMSIKIKRFNNLYKAIIECYVAR